MEQNAAYLLSRLPLVLLFANGFLVYRLLAAGRLTDLFAARLIARFNGSLARLIGAVLGASALLSFFIPNAVTVLTMLPLLARLEDDFAAAGANRRAAATALCLALVYGANIGGMGTMIGSPANLLLIGALDLFEIPGRSQIGFANWFVWSLPLVACMLGAAWLVLYLGAMPKSLRRVRPAPAKDRVRRPSARQRRALGLFALFVGFWIVFSVVRGVSGLPDFAAAAGAGAFVVVFCLLCMVSRGGKPPLLPLARLAGGLPLRGLLMLAAVAALMVAVRFLGLDAMAAAWFSNLGAASGGGIAGFFLLALAVILFTEIFSNTVVATGFFAVVPALGAGFDPLAAMMAVSAASTCAFATPVATPANALAFGEMRPRLAVMVGLGLLLNVAGAAIMSLWLPWIAVRLYGV